MSQAFISDETLQNRKYLLQEYQWLSCSFSFEKSWLIWGHITVNLCIFASEHSHKGQEIKKLLQINVNIPLAAAAHVMVIFVIPRMHGHTKQEQKKNLSAQCKQLELVNGKKLEFEKGFEMCNVNNRN